MKYKYDRRIAYNGSKGNIREIYPTGRPEEPYEAKFDGGTLGYYPSYESAYAAIQEALRDKLAEGIKHLTNLEKQRKGIKI